MERIIISVFDIMKIISSEKVISRYRNLIQFLHNKTKFDIKMWEDIFGALIAALDKSDLRAGRMKNPRTLHGVQGLWSGFRYVSNSANIAI